MLISELPLYEDSNFRTWQQPEIISDEYGNTKIEIITKTGLKMKAVDFILNLCYNKL